VHILQNPGTGHSVPPGKSDLPSINRFSERILRLADSTHSLRSAEKRISQMNRNSYGEIRHEEELSLAFANLPAPHERRETANPGYIGSTPSQYDGKPVI
jgi:hypothetical protein